jgi:AcrR family transcriptional regulator
VLRHRPGERSAIIPRVSDVKRASGPGGRPPNPEAGRQIIQAAQKLLAMDGFAGMSIEAVAAEAGVAKTTIYRRWRDKVELTTAALADLLPLVVPEATGSTYHDLVALLDHNRRAIDMGLIGTLLTEERRNPKLLETFRQLALRPRVALLREMLAAGVERGEVRADADLDAACDLILGAFLFRYLAERRPDAGWPNRIADTIWPALKRPDNQADLQ